MNLSSPLVGSSRKSNLGLMRISRAMLTLRFSPPLIPRKCQFPITVSAQSWRPISTMVLSTNAHFSAQGILSGRRSLAEYEIVSRTVRVPIKLSSCVTYAWSVEFNLLNIHQIYTHKSTIKTVQKTQKPLLRSEIEVKIKWNAEERLELYKVRRIKLTIPSLTS